MTTVRSQAKADKIKDAHPQAGNNLSFAIVEDIAQPNAFDKAVVQDPPLEAIIHCASPFHFNAEDIKRVRNRMISPLLDFCHVAQN